MSWCDYCAHDGPDGTLVQLRNPKCPVHGDCTCTTANNPECPLHGYGEESARTAPQDAGTWEPEQIVALQQENHQLAARAALAEDIRGRLLELGDGTVGYEFGDEWLARYAALNKEALL